MFIEGIAGMMSVTVTRASAIGLPLASVRLDVERIVFAGLQWIGVRMKLNLRRGCARRLFRARLRRDSALAHLPPNSFDPP